MVVDLQLLVLFKFGLKLDLFAHTMEGLPAELWDMVICLCSRRDQTALCRVSRDFQPLAARHVYGIIALRSRSQAMKCCRSIALRASNSVAVHSICIHST
jgi:hypothetical protein